MFVGILKEIKAEENRVCMTPAGVEVMIANGHSVLVEKDAGNGSGFDDAMYINAGAEMVDTPKEIFESFRHGHARQGTASIGVRDDPGRTDRFHLSAPGGSRRIDPGLIKSKSICIAYETIQKPDWVAAPAHTHERSGRAHGHPAGCQVS
jgi:alanine dehydrogenase